MTVKAERANKKIASYTQSVTKRLLKSLKENTDH